MNSETSKDGNGREGTITEDSVEDLAVDLTLDDEDDENKKRDDDR